MKPPIHSGILDKLNEERVFADCEKGSATQQKSDNPAKEGTFYSRDYRISGFSFGACAALLFVGCLKE